MFIAELNLYINYLKEMLTEDSRTDQFDKNKKETHFLLPKCQEWPRLLQQPSICIGCRQGSI